MTAGPCPPATLHLCIVAFNAQAPLVRPALDRSNAIAWTCWIGCAAIWGTTWLAIKEGYAAFPPFWAATLRLPVSGPTSR